MHSVDQKVPSTSTANTSVSFFLIPASGRPALPYPEPGGTTRRTRLPVFTPVKPSTQPLMTWESSRVKEAGSLRSHEASNTLPVLQLRPTYLTTTRSPLATGAPSPWITFRTVVSAGGFTEVGIVIVGFLSPAPLTAGRAPPPPDATAGFRLDLAE